MWRFLLANLLEYSITTDTVIKFFQLNKVSIAWLKLSFSYKVDSGFLEQTDIQSCCLNEVIFNSLDLSQTIPYNFHQY